MATSTQSTQQNGTVVAGYFATGDAAHRAVNALIDAGFLPSEIGAAFHVGQGRGAAGIGSGDEARQPNVGGTLRDELGTTLPQGSTRASTSFGAAASDTTAVQPGALGGGTGTPFGGAGKPGPISGSGINNSGLPSELKSTMPHESTMHSSMSGTSETSTLPAADSHVAGREPARETVRESEKESWTEKLKHVFGHSDSDDQASRDTAPKAAVSKDTQNFGTGKGQLNLGGTAPGLRYSRSAFENSFSSYGVQPEHARSLSGRIGQGGAIVTVHAAARAVEAERLLEAHGGEVRFAEGETPEDLSGEGQVEVFGTVRRDYPGYID